MHESNLLELKKFSLELKYKKTSVKMLDSISFSIHPSEIVGLVGESGCGKSLTGQSILGLFPPNSGKISGKILFKGEDILKFTKSKFFQYRGKKVAIVFQNPDTSLNPVFSIETQMVDIIHLHQGLNKKEAKAQAVKWLERVGLPDAEHVLKCYPHQLSGGMKQRVTIAMALSCNAELLVADEPTTALDVTIQYQILELLKELRDKLEISVFLITHNFGAAAQTCNRVIVMYGGQIVEMGNTASVLEKPRHPYTEGLIRCIPQKGKSVEDLASIEGVVPHPMNFPQGCRFANRCNKSTEKCLMERPELSYINDEHQISCFNVM